MKVSLQTETKNGSNTCGIEYALSVLGKKWTLLIIRNLSEETHRFGQLKKGLDGISTKTLAERLRGLERNNIVKRISYSEIPPRVEYSLTKKGKTLIPILSRMRDWGVKYSNSQSRRLS